ncbi:LacI family DNA-binding transcriptional regulator [Aestuariibacter sp. A3R04]|uniref:LacI family DNA-binding transcriptional regulator n=1 Tax=Aestuariibacter sp. A3R04 TaxID=2841571 RepID=UPI001C08A22F|nr:LacI family DNA-binding transcriptional regulator [Aestuariibacter sp. A3R04]MBU3023248.1 LacI family transcriptional regulator [Aestuariibacter sp. A3R04]
MATIRDVSREAGLSIATVSRAISHPEMVSKASLVKVSKAIEKLQYKPNLSSQKFRKQRTYTIVVLVPNIANLFFTEVISGIEDAAAKHGYHVLLGDTRDNHQREKDFIALVESKQADGLIQLRPHLPGVSDSFSHLKAVNVAGCAGTPYSSVRIDNKEAAEKAVGYLISQGHTRIGVITGLKDNSHTIERLQGYHNAMSAAGLVADPTWTIEGDFTLLSGWQGAQAFMRLKDKPTALFCMNDEMAIGAIKALKEKGVSIPDTLSVVGFDDLPFANYCDPALTTIRQPAMNMGVKAAEVLFQMIDGQAPQQSEYVLPFELIVRDSVKAPK